MKSIIAHFLNFTEKFLRMCIFLFNFVLYSHDINSFINKNVSFKDYFLNFSYKSHCVVYILYTAVCKVR